MSNTQYIDEVLPTILAEITATPPARLPTYSFGYAFDPVEIPELTQFVGEFNKLCERYGIGFEFHGADCGSYTAEIVSFESGDDGGFITGDLSGYTGGVPFLDLAREAGKLKRDTRIHNENQEKLRRFTEQRARDKAQAAAVAADQAMALKKTMETEGILLDGKRFVMVESEEYPGTYRLVPMATVPSN